MLQSTRTTLSDISMEHGKKKAYPRRAYGRHPKFEEAHEDDIVRLPRNTPIPRMLLLIRLPPDETIVPESQAMSIQLVVKLRALLRRWGIDHDSGSVLSVRESASGGGLGAVFPNN